MALSGKTATVLLRQCGQSSSEIAAQIAQLFEAAREWEQASKWFCIAAARAAGLAAYREASELAIRAVGTKQFSGTARDERLLEAAMQLASARQALSQFEQSIMLSISLPRQQRDWGRPKLKSMRSAEPLSGQGMLKRTAEMRAQAQQAMAIAEAAGASSAKAEGILGYERLLAGDLAAARTHLERARPALIREDALSQAAFVTGTVGFYTIFNPSMLEPTCCSPKPGGPDASCHLLCRRASDDMDEGHGAGQSRTYL